MKQCPWGPVSEVVGEKNEKGRIKGEEKEEEWGRRKERKDRKSRMPPAIGSGATHALPTAANLLCKTVFSFICWFCRVSQQCHVESVFSVRFSKTNTHRGEFQGRWFVEET